MPKPRKSRSTNKKPVGCSSMAASPKLVYGHDGLDTVSPEVFQKYLGVLYGPGLKALKQHGSKGSVSSFVVLAQVPVARHKCRHQQDYIRRTLQLLVRLYRLLPLRCALRLRLQVNIIHAGVASVRGSYAWPHTWFLSTLPPNLVHSHRACTMLFLSA